MSATKKIPLDEYINHFVYQGSYSDIQNVINQFRLDFQRMKIMLNNTLINNESPDYFINMVIRNYSNDIAHKIFACCTQAAFVYPLKILTNTFKMYTFGEPNTNEPLVVCITLNEKVSLYIYKCIQAYHNDKRLFCLNVSLKFELNESSSKTLEMKYNII